MAVKPLAKFLCQRAAPGLPKAWFAKGTLAILVKGETGTLSLVFRSLFGHPFGKAPFLQIKIFFLGGCETFGKDAFAKEPPQPLGKGHFA